MMDVWMVCSAFLLLPVLGVLGDDGWSMNVQAEVRAIDGYPVILPCSYSHPTHSQHASLQVIWRLGHGVSAVVLFRCSLRAGSSACEPSRRQDARFRLEGNPREHDLSLRISRVNLQDGGRYYCRVEITGQEHVGIEDKMGTRLRVEAPPRILSLEVRGHEAVSLSAVCSVEGSPLPDVQWVGPEDMMEGSSIGNIHAQDSSHHYHTVSQLIDVLPGQRYVCSASNPLGKDTATLYVLVPPPSACDPMASSRFVTVILVCVWGGFKVLLLVGVVTWVVKKRGFMQGVKCWWK